MSYVKKTCGGIFVILTLAINVLCADQYNNPYTSENEIVTSCCPPPACCSCNGGFFIRGDLLCWTPRINGLDLNFGTGTIVENVNECTQILTTDEVDLDPHFNWNAGYRVGVGYETDDWKAEALWTHFDGKGSKNSHKELSITNQGKVDIKLDQIDFAVGCNYDIGCSFTLKPFLGIRATRIHQHLNSFLISDITLFPSTAVTETKTFNDKQKYWGVGPLLGLEGDWEIGCGFGFYGEIAASLLYGDYNIHFDDSDIYTAPVSKQIFKNSKRHNHSFDYNVDFALGIRWHVCTCNRFDLALKLGFEQHQYFNQNRLCQYNGDVSFTGGVFSVELGF